MSRVVTGADPVNDDKLFNFADCYVTTRLDIPPIVVPGTRGPLCYFPGTVLNDIFTTDLIRFYPGIYDMSVQTQTSPLGGEVTFYINGDIIGLLDFYSPQTQETTLRVEGITITQFLHQAMFWHVTNKNPSSLGYNLMLGNFRIVKRQ